MANTISLLALASLMAMSAHALETRGANAVLDIPWESHSAAMGGGDLAMSGLALEHLSGGLSLAQGSPSGFRLSHGRHYVGSSYHGLAGAWTPENSKLSFYSSLARFNTDDIPLVDSLESVQGSQYRTLSSQDWISTTALGTHWGALELGSQTFLVYRKQDQSGLGFRSDLAARYRWGRSLWAVQIKAATSSIARWESETLEYSPPDMRLAWGWTQDAPYIYGKLNLAWQSTGIFQVGGRSSQAADAESNGDGKVLGRRAWENPLEWLQSSSLGLKHRFDMGLSLMAGWKDLHAPRNPSFGLSWHLGQWDLSFAHENHPSLGVSQKFAVSWAFPNNKPQIQDTPQVAESNPPLIPKITQVDTLAATPLPQAEVETKAAVTPPTPVLEELEP